MLDNWNIAAENLKVYSRFYNAFIPSFTPLAVVGAPVLFYEAFFAYFDKKGFRRTEKT